MKACIGRKPFSIGTARSTPPCLGARKKHAREIKKPLQPERLQGLVVVTVGLEPTTPSMWTMCSHIFTLIHSRFINVTSGFAVLMITSHCTPTNRLYTLWMMPVSLAFTIPNNTKKPGCSKVGVQEEWQTWQLWWYFLLYNPLVNNVGVYSSHVWVTLVKAA